MNKSSQPREACATFKSQALKPDRCKDCLRLRSAHVNVNDDVINRNVSKNINEIQEILNNKRNQRLQEQQGTLDNEKIVPQNLSIRSEDSEFTRTGPLMLNVSNLNDVSPRPPEQLVAVDAPGRDSARIGNLQPTEIALDSTSPPRNSTSDFSDFSDLQCTSSGTSDSERDVVLITDSFSSISRSSLDEEDTLDIVAKCYGSSHVSRVSTEEMASGSKRPPLVRDLRPTAKTGVAAMTSKFDARHPSSPPSQARTFPSTFSPPTSPPTEQDIPPGTTLVIEASKYKDEKKTALRLERKKSKRSESGDIDSAYVEELEEDLFELEDRCEILEQENRTCRRDLVESQGDREEIQKRYEQLRGRLLSLEEKQLYLEEENKTLNDRFRLPESDRYPHGDAEIALRQSELQNELLLEENDALKQEIESLQLEMEEMHDQFREENDVIAFRELQKELETTAKNCRILQFKLRKAERKNQKLEQEKADHEDRARKLEAHLQCEDDKVHIKELEDELRMAKEVSVRLHDELEMTEEKKAKYEEECVRLKDRVRATEAERQELNTQMERLKNEMERLRADLIDQGADPGTPSTPSISITPSRGVSREDSSRLSPHRAPSLGSSSRQSSTEHDVAQLMRDLSDSKERELDLKEQLKFAEEEIKITRKKLSELEEENESLVLQLRKMSQKKEMRRGSGMTSNDETDYSESEAEVDPKLHMELAEQEMNVLRRKMSELEKQNETASKELTLLQRRLTEKEREVCELLQTDPEDGLARKSTLLTAEIETLKWRLIEKDREIDRLAKLAQQPKHGAKTLKKSRSLDSDNTVDLRKQLELVTQEAAILNERLRDIDAENERLVSDNNKLLLIAKKRVPNMSIDDPRVDNVMLKDKVEHMQLEMSRLKASLRKAEVTLQEAGLSKAELTPTETPDEVKVKEKLQSAEEEIVKLRRRLSDLTKEHNELLNRMTKRRDKAKKLDELSVEELKDEIEDLDDEISELKQRIKLKEDASRKMETDLDSKKKEADALEMKYKKRERDLLEELNMLEQKNEILSNLLEAMQSRESQSTFDGSSTTSSVKSDVSSVKSSTISNRSDRSCISVISDVSLGSDEVFNNSDGKQHLTDNEKRFRQRLEYLEKLLQQERAKTVAHGGLMEQTSNLAKEKATLAAELDTCKKKLVEANQQVTDLNSRIQRSQLNQEANGELKSVIKELDGDRDRRQAEEERHQNVLRQENEDLQQRLVTYMKQTEELSHKLKQLQQRSSASTDELNATIAYEFTKDLENMHERCNAYSIKTEELHMELRQMSDKYDLLARDRAQLQSEWRTLLADVQDKEEELVSKTEALSQRENELRQRKATLENKDSTIVQKDLMLKQKEDIIRTYESSSKQREGELRKLREQVAQKEATLRSQDEKIRHYGDSLRQRDDRLREKDDIIHDLNNKLQTNKQEMSAKDKELISVNAKLADKESALAKLTERLGGGNIGIAGLQDRIASIQEEKDKLTTEVKFLKTSRNALEKSKRDLEIENQHLKDKIKVAEISRTTYTESKVVKTLLEEKSKLVEEQQRLRKELDNLRSKRGPDQDKLEKMMEEKTGMLTDASDTNERLQMEIKMLTTKLESTNTALADAHEREDNLSASLKKLEQEIKAQKELMDKRLHREEQMSEIETQALKSSYEDRLNHYQNEIQRLRSQLGDVQLEEETRACLIEDLEMHLESSRKRYNKDFTAWEIERSGLTKKLAEVSDKKREISRLNRSVDELKCELLEAEVTRSDLQHRCAMDKQEWSTERLELQNRVAQLEELTKEPRERHGKFKDLKAKIEKHARMEMVFDKERSDHKKLLTEAQQMAAKLQEQLRESESKRSNEKKELQSKHSERQVEWEREREELETRIAQYEANAQRFAYMLSKMEEMEKRTRAHEEAWQGEKRQLMAFLLRLQTCLATEREKLARMVSELKIVSDLGPLLEVKGDEAKEKKTEIDSAEKKFQDRIKQVLSQLLQVSEDITKHYNSTKEEVHNLCQWRSLPAADSSDSLYYRGGRTPSVESHTSLSGDYYGPGLTSPLKTHLSGVQSQSGSRSNTPERYGRRGVSSSPARRSHLPAPPPSFIIRPGSNTSLPLMRSTDSLDQRFDPTNLSDSTQSLTVKPNTYATRGRSTLKKAYSVDTDQQAWRSNSRASSTDSTDVKYEKVKAYLEENGKGKKFVSEERLAMDQARRRFFEGGYESGDSGFNSLPERKKFLHTASSTPVIAKVPEETAEAVSSSREKEREHERESLRESKLASLSRDIKRSFQNIASLGSKKSLSPKGSFKAKDKDKLKKSPVIEKKKLKEEKKKEGTPEAKRSSSLTEKKESVSEEPKEVKKKEEPAKKSASKEEVAGAEGGAKKKDDSGKGVGKALSKVTPSIFSTVAQRRQMFQQKAKSVDSDK